MFVNANLKIFTFMEDSQIAVRLKAIIEHLGLTDSQFADTCSISRPTLSLLLSGKNKKISDVMLAQIHKAFPKISIMWLLFGEGNVTGSDAEVRNNDLFSNENPIFQENTRAEEEQLNLINVKQLEKIVKDIIDQAINGSQQDLRELMLKISQPASLRKANKITVYYDDSTFETFVPEVR